MLNALLLLDLYTFGPVIVKISHFMQCNYVLFHIFNLIEIDLENEFTKKKDDAVCCCCMHLCIFITSELYTFHWILLWRHVAPMLCFSTTSDWIGNFRFFFYFGILFFFHSIFFFPVAEIKNRTFYVHSFNWLFWIHFKNSNCIMQLNERNKKLKQNLLPKSFIWIEKLNLNA